MMTGGTIGLWGWADEPAPSVALVHGADKNDVIEAIRLGQVVGPRDLYYIVPAAEPYADVLPHFLRVTKYPDHEVAGPQSKWDAFFQNWRELCERPYTKRGRDYALPINIALTAASEVLWGRRAAEIVRILRQDVMLKLFGSHTAFGDSEANSHVRWWTRLPRNVPDIEISLKAISRLCAKKSGLQSVVVAVDKMANNLRGLHSQKLADSLLAAAAYCWAAARVEEDEGHYGTACILAFRTLDYFLQTKAVTEGLIVEKAGIGLEFRSYSQGKGKPGVMPCYLQLKHAGRIVGSNALGDALQQCTDIRNHLLLAHSMYGMGGNGCGEFFQNTEAAARSMDKGLWRTTRRHADELLGCGVFTEQMLFAFDEDLDTSVVSIDLPAAS